jgi:hypothetical protein
MTGDTVFTFWEGTMPEYIKACMGTWQFPYVVLNYENLHEYTDFNIKKAKRFSLPQFADCVRVHVLRDNGGYWLDTDTIMLSQELPTADVLGNPTDRSHTIGYLHTEAGSDMYCKWASYQDTIISNPNSPYSWDIMGNAFTNKYVWEHRNVIVESVMPMHPEEVMISGDAKRKDKYKQFYFKENYSLSDLPETPMLMLHNSWTPIEFRTLNRYKLMSRDCTLSNILREVTGG